MISVQFLNRQLLRMLQLLQSRLVLFRQRIHSFRVLFQQLGYPSLQVLNLSVRIREGLLELLLKILNLNFELSNFVQQFGLPILRVPLSFFQLKFAVAHRLLKGFYFVFMLSDRLICRRFVLQVLALERCNLNFQLFDHVLALVDFGDQLVDPFFRLKKLSLRRC